MSSTTEELVHLMEKRIVVLDGGMGTLIQQHKPGEAEYRGERFRGHHKDVKGNSDLLCLTQPDMIRSIHEQYLEAGADIVETNTFTATRVAQADYDLEDAVYETNVRAAQLARQAADAWTAKTPQQKRYVAGSIGAMNRALSLSPDVNDPAFRAVTFDEVRDSYAEQVRGLI